MDYYKVVPVLCLFIGLLFNNCSKERQYEGTWKGTTKHGKPIEFIINNKGFKGQCIVMMDVETWTVDAHIEGRCYGKVETDSFDVDFHSTQNGFVHKTIDLMGRFTSPNEVSGTLITTLVSTGKTAMVEYKATKQ